jgi:hypothetical protein
LRKFLDSANTTLLDDGDKVSNKSASNTATSNAVKSAWEHGFPTNKGFVRLRTNRHFWSIRPDLRFDPHPRAL